MGCKNSKSLSVLERYKQESESAGYEEPETTNPMSPPIRTSLRLSIPGSKDSKEKSERGGSGGDGGKSFAHRMSTFTERLRGSSVDKNQASDAASSGPQIKPPPSFLFTGRRFRKHHNSSFAEMTGMGQGRILKLVSSGEIVWYKTKGCEGVPERGEASEPDGSFKLEVVKHIQMGCPSKPSIKNQECCLSITATHRTLNLEAESSAVALQWKEALCDHLRFGMLASVDLGDDIDAEKGAEQQKSLQAAKLAMKEEERDKAYHKHSKDREKLARARASSAQRASVYA